MPLPVQLQSVVEEMDVMNDDWVAYINRRTGELVTVTDYDLEEGTEAVQVGESPDFIELPSKYDLHEYDIVERFCGSVSEVTIQEKLFSAIRGGGAFRRFKDSIRRFGIEDEWYEFRHAALESIASSFLDASGIPYKKG